MPALSSLIAYRPGKKAKAAIKAPFSLLRGDSATASSVSTTTRTTTRTTSQQHFTPTDVIDINHSRQSSNIDVGTPSISLEQDVFDTPGSSQHNPSTSPQVELDIDLSSNGFSDWLEAFNSADAKKDAYMKRLTRLRNSISMNARLEELKDGEAEVDGRALLSEDLFTSLEAMDASHRGEPPEHGDILQGFPSIKRPNSITIPDGNFPDDHQSSRPDLSIGTRTARPLSSQSDVTSSALSGTTIARALMSNSFVLSTDRASLYRSGTGAGLTRTDSATLPRWDRNSSMMFYNDRFSFGSDPPPIPSNAELLYEPPRKSRNEEKRDKRSSTGSQSPIIPQEIPSNGDGTNSNNTLPNSDINDDIGSDFLPGTPPSVKPSISRLPLPRTPSPRLMMDETMTPNQASTPLSQEVNQHTPVNAQVLSPDSDTPSSVTSSDHTSPQELEGLLNYYSLPDAPELLVTGGGFKPMFSPISEESSSQLSPPIPYRNDRRDSYRSQLVGARSPLSGSLRVRDSEVLPKKDQSIYLLSQREGAQSKILPPSSTTSTSESSFYFTGDNNSETAIIPPQPIFHKRSGSTLSSIKVERNSRDMDAYNITMASSLGDATQSAEGLVISPQFPETANPFSPISSARANALGMAADGGERSHVHTSSMSATAPELPLAQLLLKRASVDRSQQGSLSIRTTASASSSSPSSRIEDISESLEAIPSTLSPTADGAIPEAILPLPSSSSEPSANPSNISLSMDDSRSSSVPNVEQDASDDFTSSADIDSTTKSRMKGLPSIPITSPITLSSSDDKSLPLSLPGTSTAPTVLAETFATPPSPARSQSVKPSVPRGRLPPAALNISRNTSVSGPDRPIAVNGTDQGGQKSADLEFQQPRHDSPGSDAFSTQNSLGYRNENFRGRASDIFRGTSLGSPPPYYSVVSEALSQSPNFPGPPFFFPNSQASDSIAGPSSGESTISSEIGRSLARESSYLGQRTRIRPPLPAGPRRPSQHSLSSPGPRHGSFSSVVGTSVVPDSRVRPSTRPPNPLPSPSFQAPTPKWKGFTMEVAKWTFTSAQLQAVVARAIRQSAQASSIRLLKLEVLDDEIPEEIMRLESQRNNVVMRYKASARRRATILDSLHSSMSVLEDVNSTYSLIRQLDELKELTQSLDRLAEELHSVDQQLSYLESLIHIHTGSALALALRKLNSSFLKQVAENQVLRNKIQSLEAERDEAWQQAQRVANEYDQLNNSSPSTHSSSSRVSAKRKSSSRVSRAGLRTPNWSPPGIGNPIISATRSLPPPLPKLRPGDIVTDFPIRNSIVLSTSEITPTTESRALAQAQDELYAMLGILDPERHLHRSRSASSAESPQFLLPQSAQSQTRRRRSSLPAALSLPEAYNVMAVDADMSYPIYLQRNAVLATIDLLSALPS